MKKILFTLFTLSLFITSAQSIWIADNNPSAPTGTNIFGTIQEAIDAAVAGDTIYIQPSPTTYAGGTSNVELHFRGIGFNLDKDIPYTSNVTSINLYGAPDGSTNPSNSSVSGLTITNLRLGKAAGGDPSYTLVGVRVFNNSVSTITYGIPVPVDDLLIAFNYINNLSFNESVDNSIIRNNVFDGSIQFFSCPTVTTIISNNIINGNIYKNSTTDFLTIQNNNFIGNGTSSTAFNSIMFDANVINNIFYGTTPSISFGGTLSTNFQNNTFNNNLTFSTGDDTLPPTGGGFGNTGNGGDVGIDPQFTTATLSTIWQSTDNYTTAAAEVTNGGTDASDIGIFGGPYPFVGVNLQLSTSSIPTIQSLNISTIINPGQDLQVDVSAKSN